MNIVPEVISVGAGVQSSTIGLMAKHGLITPMPIAGVFADTQAEPASVYRWLDWLEKQLPFPIYRVTKGSLEERDLELKVSKTSGQTYRNSMIPAYTEDGGILPRKCTKDFKVLPVLSKVRELAGGARDGDPLKIIQWIGISTDEVMRMKQLDVSWVQNRWPLVEMRMNRQDCLTWMEKNGYPRPPRSACRFCPYHSDYEWSRLKEEEPNEFLEAVAFEKRMQAASAKSYTARSVPFLHGSRQPLDQVQFSDKSQRNLFNNECEGMCGS